MGNRWLVVLTCLAGHRQEITVEMPHEQAVDFAEMLAGRSRFFVYPIPEDQVDGTPGRVGFCAYEGCGARIEPPTVTEAQA